MSSVIIASLPESLPAFIAQIDPSAIAVLVDNHTYRHCYPVLKSILPKHTLIRIRAGEEQKHLATCQTIWDALTRANFDRHGLLLNLGGGVIGDMGGFCAATYKRGIAFAQLPTTLLSQVDASVGGKLGIDFQGLKNHIGVFKLPDAVLIDPAMLATLPERELRSGFAEIIKHCLIADAEQWQKIRRLELNEQNWPELVAHSVAVKERVVAQDPTEKGLRKILNFGHTLGHAIETHFLEDSRRRLLHGEAIAAGMVAEAYIAFKKGMIDETLLTEIEEYLFAVYGRTRLKDEDMDPILTLTLQDKKNRAGQVRMALLDGRGSCAFDVPVTKAEMKQGLFYYRG
ncbi:3-dehydroquinate synthase [Rudanella paleaurantiibacter]|uniref:3-dehydroquinate synthase n=1 Tax=Rudanella paleaurantiibacter TaxID=2614655 RepID=A0A7J5U0P0_9BACT|nr:3-dehydroquinate synthase [Rudanella paleaurantiibacter]KAB7731318.1 3-dehydroquinate synthase [Rudanella paleaurantiibacter]